MNYSVQANAAQQRELKQKVDLQLLRSFNYLLNVAKKGLHEDLSKLFQKVETSLKVVHLNYGRLSGMAYVLHAKLKASIEEQNASEVRNTFELLHHCSFISQSLRIDSIQAKDFTKCEIDTLMEVSKMGYKSSYGKEADLHPLAMEEVNSNVKNVKKALDCIQKIHPAAYAELKNTITDILLYRSSMMNSGSSLNSLGMITMSRLRAYQNWTTFVEAIVHEAGHQALYNIMLNEPILEPGKNLYYSPLRKEKRPMIGIFHALFVVSRIVEMTELLKVELENTGETIPIISPHNNSGNDAPAIDKFYILYTTVKENARLTSVGKSIMDSCLKLVEEVVPAKATV